MQRKCNIYIHALMQSCIDFYATNNVQLIFCRFIMIFIINFYAVIRMNSCGWPAMHDFVNR